MTKQHLALLCDNKPGVLTHVAGLISRRAINIECINAGYTEESDVTRINIVVSVENRWELDQAVNQLAKLIDVIKVVNLDDVPFVSYELAMIKIRSLTPEIREELTNIANLFKAKIVDVQRHSLIMRITGREDRIEALLEMLKDYEIIEIARTGQISLSRGETAVKDM
ncbi:acetolactate synthase small subunit [Megasphaera sp.]|uniref:acetolactate synthase small subunit n=1 Tax=Megasphaera sp. TaxID=2023260 RepID=UPI0027B93E87|nr:acetolactate synthase small subunit [Megasphaera sp.]